MYSEVLYWIVFGACMGLIELAVRSDFLYKHKVYKEISCITIANIGIIIMSMILMILTDSFSTMIILLLLYMGIITIKCLTDMKTE